MKKIITSLLLFFCTIGSGYSQDNSMKLLYIGNSYTYSYLYTNNVPVMVMSMFINCGFSIMYSSDFVVAPGGATFQDHCSGRAMTLIRQGGWDYVILQEQSQYPAFPIKQVEQECFPYAQQLVDNIYDYSPCAVPLFFMTWGRENGDQENAEAFPPIGTYEGMDSLLYARYMIMKEQNDAAVAPVGRVWRYIRNNFPDIDLYQSDGSHPTEEGTYATAATIFTLIHRVDPMQITQYGDLSEDVARNILLAVKAVAYDSLDRWLRPMPVPEFTFVQDSNSFSMNNSSLNATSYEWDFGDGTTSEEENPTHTYTEPGTYNIILTAKRHCMEVAMQTTVEVEGSDSTLSITDMSIDDCIVYPNPATTSVMVKNVNERIEAIVIYDVAGRVIGARKVDDYSVQLDVQTLDKGLYIMRIITSTGEQVYRKLVVE